VRAQNQKIPHPNGLALNRNWDISVNWIFEVDKIMETTLEFTSDDRAQIHAIYNLYALPPATFFLTPLDLADLLFFNLVPCSKAVESTRSRPMSSSFLTAKIRTIQFSEVNASSAGERRYQLTPILVEDMARH
jgi:hypothetical protein